MAEQQHFTFTHELAELELAQTGELAVPDKYKTQPETAPTVAQVTEAIGNTAVTSSAA